MIETKRLLKIRVREHGDGVKKIGDGMPFTRWKRKASHVSETERHKSAITAHVVKENHVMDWDSARIAVKESDWRTRGIN